MSQTKAQLIDPTDGSIVNADINASAAIAGTKVSPDFGSQNIATTGTITSNDITIQDSQPRLNFVDNSGSPNDPDYLFQVDGGNFVLHDITNTADRLVVKSGGNIGLGTTSPTRLLHLEAASSPSILIKDTTQSCELQLLAQDANAIVGTNSNHPLRFTINNSEKARVHTGGEFVVGHSTTTTISNGENPFLQIKATDSRAGASFVRHSADSSSGGIYLGKPRNGTIGSNTIVQNGDELGRITFSGDDGNDIHTVAAEIKSFVDGAPGANDMPGRLGFYTCPDGSAGAVERMRIDNAGRVLLGTATSNNNASLQVTTTQQVVATFESTGNDPQIYLGDDMSSPSDNALVFGYDRADNRGYLTVAGDADTALTVNNGSLIGINTSAPVEHFGVAGNIRLVTPSGTTRRINSIATGGYNVGSSGGSAIGFTRFSDGGGNSDQIIFETHHHGVRHDTSVTISKEGFLRAHKNPYFQAFGTNDNQTYTGVITLENVKYNVGGYWKTSAGTGQHQRFTAPVAGVYLFMFGFFPNSASTCRIELRVNGTAQTNPYISGIHSDMGSGFPAISGSQILALNANDYVEIAISSGTLTNTYDGHTGFSGVFLG